MQRLRPPVMPIEALERALDGVENDYAPRRSGEPANDLHARVAARFSLVPNFFQTAGDAPGLIDELPAGWGLLAQLARGLPSFPAAAFRYFGVLVFGSDRKH